MKNARLLVSVVFSTLFLQTGPAFTQSSQPAPVSPPPTSVTDAYRGKNLEELTKLHEEGDWKASFALAKLIIGQSGSLEKGALKALPYLQRASEAGSKEATIFIAGIYLKGADGIPKDENRGMAMLFSNGTATLTPPASSTVPTDKAPTQKSRRTTMVELDGIRATTVQEAQAKAIEKIPEIGIKDSVENILFRAIYAGMQEDDRLTRSLDTKEPSKFSNPNWPIDVAKSIALLGDDIRGRLLSGTMSGELVFFYIYNLDPAQLKAVLGPPDSAFGDQWEYRNAVIDRVTEKRASLWLDMQGLKVRRYRVGFSTWNVGQ